MLVSVTSGSCGRSVVRWLMVVMVVMVLMGMMLPRLWAAIPNSGPNAYTQKDYVQDLLGWLRKHMVQAYDEAGHTNPKWDALAKQRLELYARGVIDKLVDGPYKLERGELKERDALTERLIRLGCDDPLVLHCHAMLLHRQGRTMQARREAPGRGRP